MKNKYIFTLLLIFSLSLNALILKIIEPGVLRPNENSMIIEFKIKNNIFEYKTQENPRDYNDYDFYLLNKEYSLPVIFSFIKDRNKSRFYHFLNFLYKNNNEFLEQSDLYIVDSLRFFIAKEFYVNEINTKVNKKLFLSRISKIKEDNEYLFIYKQKFLETFK